MKLQQLQKLSVSRCEFKYCINLTDRLYLLEQLDQLLIPDAYGDYNGYTVRSVYFDSIANDDYIAKINHENEKKRIRLRVYTPNDKVAKLELKRKLYGKELKESLIISKDDALALLDKNYSILLNYPNPIASYLYDIMTTRLYRPVALIEYDRRAYTHPNFNTRITMDNNLRYSDTNFDLFSTDINFKKAMNSELTILEIKYDRFLFKQIQDVLTKCDLSKKPISKYGSARSLLKHYYYYEVNPIFWTLK